MKGSDIIEVAKDDCPSTHQNNLKLPLAQPPMRVLKLSLFAFLSVWTIDTNRTVHKQALSACNNGKSNGGTVVKQCLNSVRKRAIVGVHQ